MLTISKCSKFKTFTHHQLASKPDEGDHKETTAASSPRSHWSHWRFRISTTKRGAGDSWAQFWVWQMHATRLKFEFPRCLHPAGPTTSQASGKGSPNHRPSLPLPELWKVSNSCPAWCKCRLIKWSGTGSRRTRVAHLWVSLCKWKVTLGFTKVALTHLKLEGKTKTNDNKRIETSKRVEAKRCVTCGYLHQIKHLKQIRLWRRKQTLSTEMQVLKMI